MDFRLLFTCYLAISFSAPAAVAADAVGSKKEPSPSRIVAGQVLDSNGLPAQGALVVWSLSLNHKDTGQDCVQGRTDDNGNFRLESPAGYLKPIPIFPDDRIWVHQLGHDVFSTTAASAEIAPGEKPFWTCTLQPHCGQKLEIRVVDPAEHAIQGQLVEVSQVHIEDKPGSSRVQGFVPLVIREQLSAITDEHGVANLKGYPKDWAFFAVDVISEKHGRMHVRLNREQPTPLTVKLLPAGRLEGHIKPLGDHRRDGFRIAVIISSGEGAPGHSSPYGTARANTDREGRFTVPSIAAGPLQVTTFGQSTATALPISPVNVELVAGTTATIALTMQPTVTATGLVRLIGTGKPIPDADVELRSASGQFFMARTDSEGRYRSQLPAGFVNATGYVMAGPWEWGQRSFIHMSWTDFNVSDGKGVIELPPLEFAGTALEGRVLDQAGAPVRRKRVAGMDMNVEHAVARTDDEGRFRMYCPADKSVNTFSVRVEGKARSTKSVSQSPLELTLSD